LLYIGLTILIEIRGNQKYNYSMPVEISQGLKTITCSETKMTFKNDHVAI